VSGVFQIDAPPFECNGWCPAAGVAPLLAGPVYCSPSHRILRGALVRRRGRAPLCRTTLRRLFGIDDARASNRAAAAVILLTILANPRPGSPYLLAVVMSRRHHVRCSWGENSMSLRPSPRPRLSQPQQMVEMSGQSGTSVSHRISPVLALTLYIVVVPC